jgi:hypothetical protein
MVPHRWRFSAATVGQLDRRLERAERERDEWRAECLSARAALARMLEGQDRPMASAAERLAFFGGRIEALGTLAASLPAGIRAPVVAAYCRAWAAFSKAAAELVMR